MRAATPWEPVRHTALFALTVLTLTALHIAAYAPFLSPAQPCASRVVREYVHDEVPQVWQRLGANRARDVSALSRSVSTRQVFRALVDEAMAPWSGAVVGGERVPISASLVDSMEVPNKGSTARIRLPGDGRVLYRVVEHWEKTYRLPRLLFFLDLLLKVMSKYPELSRLRCEFYLNTADGPKVTVDSMSQDFGALPILGFRTEAHYIDIPVPDPVEHGSKVTGEGYVIDPASRVAWQQKEARVVFRGVASCIQKQHFGNWHLNPRVRVSSISARFPHLVDAGVTKWIKLSHGTTVDDIETSANISVKQRLTLQDHMRFKYILDVDGGLGSSRKRWMLMSGSTPFFQASAVTQWYEPLLTKWVHYVPVDRWFRDLVQSVLWARQNDAVAREIAENAMSFADRFLSEDAILEYLAVFLQKYAELQPDARQGNESVPNPCVEEPSIEHGPMGCRTGWFRHLHGTPFPFGCRHKPEVEGSFVCHRPHPTSGRKQVKHGIYEPYPSVEGIELPRKRPGIVEERIV